MTVVVVVDPESRILPVCSYDPVPLVDLEADLVQGSRHISDIVEQIAG